MELSRAESISLNACWTWRTCEMTPSVVFSRFGWALSRWKRLSTEEGLLQDLPRTDPGSNNPQWIVVVVLPLLIFVFGRPRTLLIFSRKYKVAPNLLSTAFLFRFSFFPFFLTLFEVESWNSGWISLLKNGWPGQQKTIKFPRVGNERSIKSVKKAPTPGEKSKQTIL